MDNAIIHDCLSQQHLRVGPIFSSLRILREERQFWMGAFNYLLVVDIAEGFEVIVVLGDLQSFLWVDHENRLFVQSLQDQSFDEIRPQRILAALALIRHFHFQEFCIDIFVDGVECDRSENTLLEL